MIRVTEIGDSLGFALPGEVLAMLNVGEGDTGAFVEMPDGLHLTSREYLVDKQVELGAAFMEEYGDVLRALAKGPDPSKRE